MLNSNNDNYEPTATLEPPKSSVDKILDVSLPPLPGSVFKILELLRDENITTPALATAVGYDPLLAARLLRLANSSFYSRQKAVTTISQAIDTMGTKSLYDAVMLGMTANTFSKEIQGAAVGRAIWEHSLAVALLSRRLVEVLQMRGAEDAFICALLHDIGKLVLLKCDSEGFSRLAESMGDDEMLSAETEYFGVNHAEVGALLTKKWDLPDVISTIVMNHHDPSKASVGIFTAHVINAADTIASEFGFSAGCAISADETDPFEIKTLESESITALKLTQSQISEAWTGIQESLQDILAGFRS